MNTGQISRLLSGFALFFSLSLLVPLAVALFEETKLPTAYAFTEAMVIGLGVALLLWFAGRKSGGDFFRKEGLAVVGLAWVLAGLIAAIPFLWSGAIPSRVDALFESIAGLTTTGATVLGTGNIQIEDLPTSLLLWRSMIQWMGGLGIILVFIVLLPGMGVTGARLLSSEQVGISDDAARPRLRHQAQRLFMVYLALTLAAGLAYWLVGLPAFTALCHAFTTLATGGFSTHNVSVGGFQNLGVELVAIVFMFLAGCNFLLVLGVMTRGKSLGTKKARLLHNVEFRVYLGLMIVVALGTTLSLWFWGQPVRDDSLGFTHDYSQFGRCLRDGVFQTVSILTSTGYSTANFEDWPKPALYLLIGCMFIGASTGSTAGGFKVLRVIVCIKMIGYALRHFVQPRTVEKLRVGSDVIPDRIVTTILALLVLWMVTVAAGTFVLDLDPRLDLVSAFTASLSMTGCVGPAISEVVPAGEGTFQLVGKVDLGPYSGYGELRPWAKLFMCLQMILGRLEILAPFVLLTPGFWRR